MSVPAEKLQTITSKKLKFNERGINQLINGMKTETRRPVIFPTPVEGWHSNNCPYGKKGDAIKLCDENGIAFGDAVIFGVSIEYLHAITEEGARAEGCESSGWTPSYSNPDNAGGDDSASAVDDFHGVWQYIYGGGEYDWNANPFVWVIKFNRI